jgi:hypothetical protein
MLLTPTQCLFSIRKGREGHSEGMSMPFPYIWVSASTHSDIPHSSLLLRPFYRMVSA